MSSSLWFDVVPVTWDEMFCDMFLLLKNDTKERRRLLQEAMSATPMRPPGAMPVRWSIRQ